MLLLECPVTPFVLSMLELRAVVLRRSMQSHSIYLPCHCMMLAIILHAPQRSAFFLEAVRTLLWCLYDKGDKEGQILFNYILKKIIYSFSCSLLHFAFLFLKIKVTNL